MKVTNIFKKVSETVIKKSEKRRVYFLAFLLLIFAYMANNKITFKQIRGKISEMKQNMKNRMKGEDGLSPEEREENIKKQMEMIKKEEEERRKKIEREMKKENEKKEIIPETELPDFKDMKESEDLTSPVSIFTRLHSLEEAYQRRLAEGKIPKRAIREKDYVYYETAIVSEIRMPPEAGGNVKRTESDGGKIFLMAEKNNSFSKMFLGKRVGDTFSVDMDVVFKNASKEKNVKLEGNPSETLNKNLSDVINNAVHERDPDLKNVNIEVTEIIYNIKICDIMPLAVIKELKLDNENLKKVAPPEQIEVQKQ
ncbi:MAG: hypothetical protein LBB09_03860 [Rickettsiales bacterium]|nr:hypothetical protein [Rickettsiales bacterium]